MRLCFIVRRSGSGDQPISPIAAETIEKLRALGAQVDVIIVEDQPFEVAELQLRHDLYVLKSKVPLTLSIAGALTLAGATVVNSFRSHNLASDKIATTGLLAAAGIPVPPSWATGQGALLRPLRGLATRPLWLKPPRGKQGAGVQRLAAGEVIADDLLRATHDSPLFAQREVPSSGQDLKVYVIGDKIWSLLKPWPARTASDKLGVPVALPAEIRDAALACGRALGLELYGVDFLASENRFFVVDVNPFPGYHGVPNAPDHLAEYLSQRALRLNHQANVVSPVEEYL